MTRPPRTNNHRSRRTPRRAISLLEIMISIGVVGIGLIGVAALIPLAHHKAAQGVQEDRKTQFGKRAFREFRVRGMDRLENLAFVNESDPSKAISAADPASLTTWVQRPFCLDPLMVASRPDSGSRLFPWGKRGDIAAPRVTLFSGNPAPVNVPTWMLRPQAEELFLLRDDLTVIEPDDVTLPARLGYLNAENGTGQIPVRLESAGGYSWMATLVPQPMVGSDMYTLSIVVFYRRNLNVLLPEDIEEITAQIPAAPAVPPATGVVPAAYLAGPVKDLTVPLSLPERDFGWSKLAQDDWLLVTQIDHSSQPYNIQNMKWYRVLMASVNNGEVQVTLDGPDWDVSQFADRLFAVYLRGVVAVYEKTVRLQRSSIYAM